MKSRNETDIYRCAWERLVLLADAEERDVVDDGPAEGREVVAAGVVVCAEEHDADSGVLGHESEDAALGPTVALGLVRDLHRRPVSKRLHHHGPLAGVARVPDRERQHVRSPWHRPHHLKHIIS